MAPKRKSKRPAARPAIVKKPAKAAPKALAKAAKKPAPRATAKAKVPAASPMPFTRPLPPARHLSGQLSGMAGQRDVHSDSAKTRAGWSCGQHCGSCCGCHILGLFCQPRMWVAVLLAVVLTAAFSYLLHGVYLMNDYQATAPLWRSPETMRTDLVLLGQSLQAVLFALVFALAYRGWNWLEGVKVGVLLGAIPALGCMVAYATQPLPFTIVTAWAAGSLLHGALLGLVLAYVFGGCKDKSCTCC